MASHTLPQHAAIGPISFPLSKFSFATVSGEMVKPIPWTHLSDKGHLFVVFETVLLPKYNGEFNEKSRFKVLAKPEVMEDLDLNALGREATNAAQEMKTRLAAPKLPLVTIIIQEPCIAIRFPLQYGQIRRFQIKFKEGSHFYKALAIFSQAGCSFTQAGSLAPTAQPSRPHTASSATVPGDSYPQAGGSFQSSALGAHYHQNAPVQNPDGSPRSSGRPSTSSTIANLSQSSSAAPSAITWDTSRDLESSEKTQTFSFLPSTKYAPDTIKLNKADPDVPNKTSTEALEDHHFPLSDLSGIVSSLKKGSLHGLSPSGHSAIVTRPSTAPTFGSENLSEMLPPKRELPFEVPKTAAQSRRKASSDGQENAIGNAGVASGSNIPNVAGKVAAIEQDTGGKAVQKASKANTRRGRGSATAPRSAVASSRFRKKSSCPRQDSLVPSDPVLRRSERVSARYTEAVPARDNPHSSAVPQLPSTNAEPGYSEPIEEMLKPSSAHKKAVGKARKCVQAYQHSDKDTRALLDPANEQQQQRGIKRSDNTDHPSGSATSPFAKRVASSSSARTQVAEPLEAAFASSETYPLPSFGHSSECSRQPAQKTIEPVAAASYQTKKTDVQERQQLATVYNHTQAEPGPSLKDRATMALMNDPDFARSPEIAQWAELPLDERNAALESWMCQQLESEHFATLLKTMGGMWQRVLFDR